ncbi:FHA domain-containing protein [Rhodovulum euryhalinum]|uniref:FHA domain-containing protein n=1 Tax=Rhodovulum euryhalinum TaxID=35805 RepID=A0A4R2KV03_9RHOB|nr:FHA domain-containing protein [Rhodovulum euryhalinum]TCO74018.1 FHA domain-containing protein [Rhodovulum euryhalinum]
MKFLRRKSGDRPVEDDFNDYVAPFPPARHRASDPVSGPVADPMRTPPAPFRDSDGVGQPPDAWEDDPADEVAGAPFEADGFASAACAAGTTAQAPLCPSADAPALDDGRPVLFPGGDRRQRPPIAEDTERREAVLPHADAAPATAAMSGPDPAPTVAPPLRSAMPPTEPRAEDMAAFEVPPPAVGRAGARAGRTKTRLLGFGQPADPAADPFARDEADAPAADGAPDFPVGWLVVVDGPGRGAHFALGHGVSQIGRGADQTVRLDFGDSSISRSGHALLAYDDEQAKFFLGSGGKVNIVRLNGQPLLSTEELAGGDVIRIGETTLRFVAFCGPDFTWATDRRDDDGN